MAVHGWYSLFWTRNLVLSQILHFGGRIHMPSKDRVMILLLDADNYHFLPDCDTCRWMAPDVFSRVDDQSAVTSQPTSHEGRIQALRALLSCPT